MAAEGGHGGAAGDRDAAISIARVLNDGIVEIASGLASTQHEWLNHGLGDVSAVKAAADRAVEEFGAEASMKLKAEADKVHHQQDRSSVAVAEGGRSEVEAAVVKQRAALWLMLDPGGRDGRAAHAAASILETRCQFWEKVWFRCEFHPSQRLHFRILACLLAAACM